jgi:sec-independent protein translocase protein TatC
MLNYFLEIKNRLLLLFLTFFSMLLIIYFYKEIILFLIVNSNKYVYFYKNTGVFYFIFTDVYEIFYVYMQIFFFLCLQTNFLYLVYHFFIFIGPAIYKSEYIIVSNWLKISMVVWLISIFFAHYLIIPLTWNFFVNLQSLKISFNLYFEAKLNEYILFYVSLCCLCIFYFQTIVYIILFFFYSNIDKTKNIKQLKKVNYFLFFIFSTLFSPPDVFSQITISFTFIFLYEILVFCLLLKLFLIR